jgi:hypothetical protein
MDEVAGRLRAAFRGNGPGLPDAVLRKVYHENAARLLGLDPGRLK